MTGNGSHAKVDYPPLADIREEFAELETSDEQIQYLIELGSELPELPSSYCTEEFRVMGCQSMVWIVPDWDGERLYFTATSDAPMVRGLVAILLSTYSGHTPKEIIDFPIEDLFTELGIKRFLSPLRSNGLYSMVKRIQQYAELKLTSSQRTEVVESRRAQDASNVEDFGPIAQSIATIRSDFPILSQVESNGVTVAYLDNAATSQRPIQVIDAMGRVYKEHYANVHRSGHQWATETTIQLEASRQAVRRYIGASSTDEIIFTSGTTAAVNLVAQAWGGAILTTGDEILLSEMEHHSNIVPWHQIASRTGAKIRWIPIRDDYELDLDQFATLLTRNTKIVAVTSTSNVLGTFNPIKSIAEQAHTVGAKVFVDAAQSVPHGPIDVTDWDADFVAFGGHKMLAATGVGVCYGKREHLESMPAWQGGGSMIKTCDLDGFMPADLPHKFEAGTPPIVEIISLKPAIEYLTRIGKQRLLEHERNLVQAAEEGMRRISGLRIFGPEFSKRSGIISFSIDGIHADEISKVLDCRGIAVRTGHHCAMPLHKRFGVSTTCRASFYLYNTLDEVARLIEAVEFAARTLR
jgi:cysteine desulfurase / selenocysteine lyase